MNHLIAAVVLVLLGIGASVLLYGCLIVAGIADRLEEQQAAEPAEEPVDPCNECLRWPECNGVDSACPLREEASNGKS